MVDDDTKAAQQLAGAVDRAIDCVARADLDGAVYAVACAVGVLAWIGVEVWEVKVGECAQQLVRTGQTTIGTSANGIEVCAVPPTPHVGQMAVGHITRVAYCGGDSDRVMGILANAAALVGDPRSHWAGVGMRRLPA